jgi:hypothetical protein
MIAAATRAPSVLNTQPWLFEIGADRIDLFADPARQLPVTDADGRQRIMSCGAALLNLRLAMLASGWDAVVAVLPDPDDVWHVACVERGRALAPPAGEVALFETIPSRRTNRRPFSPERPRPEAVAKLVEAAGTEGVEGKVLGGTKGLAVADMVVRADRELRADRAVRAEIEQWTHADPSRLDGIPVAALGPVAQQEAAMVRDFGFGEGSEARGDSAFEENPTLLLLSTTGDTPRDWVSAGQALERVQLTATSLGLATSFLGQPFETGLRAGLRSTSTSKGMPQMLLRVGHGPTSPVTPRRPVNEVIRQRSWSHGRGNGTVGE